jgi:DNA gyrase subunit A
VILATKRGIVKKTSLMAFSHPRATGIHAITLDEGDELVSAIMTTGREKLLLATKKGMALLMEEGQLRPMLRGARGVKGITLRKDDELISLNAAPSVQGSLVTITENGYGKRTHVSQYRVQRRGGLGLINIKVTPKNGSVVSVFPAADQDNIVVITSQGKLIRVRASEIKLVGRAAVGVRIIDVANGEKVVGAQRVAEAE